MSKKFNLEYKEEIGMFHNNYGNSKPNTFGWETVIFDTSDYVSTIFCESIFTAIGEGWFINKNKKPTIKEIKIYAALFLKQLELLKEYKKLEKL
jgi:hypothetical protein